jgi:hypothetical protein
MINLNNLKRDKTMLIVKSAAGYTSKVTFAGWDDSDDDQMSVTTEDGELETVLVEDVLEVIK